MTNRARDWWSAAWLSMLLGAALPAFAESLVASDSTGNVITITDAPCKLEWLSKWKAAEFLYQGKTYKACWAVKGSSVVILDAEGDLTAIPVSMFKKENRT